jgi:phage I-like protein
VSNLVTLRAAVGQFGSYDTADLVPSEFRLLKAGENDYLDGKLIFDEESAKSVLAAWSARKLDLMADYEHQSLNKPPIEAPASAKKWVPELRNGELWATNIQWTKKAREYLANGEYRYFSIAARVNKDTKRVASLVNFGLTNNPAANEIEPLVAASITASDSLAEETSMKETIVALGLRADATDIDTASEARKLVDFKREVLAVLKAPSAPEALGKLQGLTDSHDKVVALTARVREIETEKRVAEFDAVAKEAEAKLLLTPAQMKGEWLASMRASDTGLVQLKSYLATALPYAQADKKVETQAKTAVTTGTLADYTADEIAIARVFVGDNEAAIKERCEMVRKTANNDFSFLKKGA